MNVIEISGVTRRFGDGADSLSLMCLPEEKTIRVSKVLLGSGAPFDRAHTR